MISVNGVNRVAALVFCLRMARRTVAGACLLSMLTGLALVCRGSSGGARTARAQTVQRPIPTLQPPVAGYVFPERQTLTFTVDWRVFTGGTAVFHLEQQGDQLHVTATADTVGAVNLLFPVVDRFQSAMDTRTGCSEGFWKQVQEGRRKVSSDLTFDYHAGKQTQVERNLVKGTQKQQTTSIPGVRDGLAVGDLLCGVAAADGGAGLRLSAGRRDAHGDGDDEGGGARGDQDAGGDVPDHPGAADGRGGRGEEPRQHLDLVYGRRAPYPGADPGAAVLGDDHLPPAERGGEVSRNWELNWTRVHVTWTRLSWKVCRAAYAKWAAPGVKCGEREVGRER